MSTCPVSLTTGHWHQLTFIGSSAELLTEIGMSDTNEFLGPFPQVLSVKCGSSILGDDVVEICAGSYYARASAQG